MTFSEKIEDFVINKCGLSQEDVEDFENDGMWLSNAIIKYAYGRKKDVTAICIYTISGGALASILVS